LVEMRRGARKKQMGPGVREGGRGVSVGEARRLLAGQQKMGLLESII
jgi:hypothetical protein